MGWQDFMGDVMAFGANAYVKRRARREIEDIFNKIGPKRLSFMVAQGIGLSKLIMGENAQQQLEQARAKAAQMPELAQIFTEADIYAMVPAWAQTIIDQAGAQGVAWKVEQMNWLRSFFPPASTDLPVARKVAPKK